MPVPYLESLSLFLQSVHVAGVKDSKGEVWCLCFSVLQMSSSRMQLVLPLTACTFSFPIENGNAAGDQVKVSSLYFYGRLSRVQARGEQILLQARSSHLPVHWVLFLSGLSHSNEIQEDHARSKEHYIRGNLLCGKGFYQGEGVNETCLSLFEAAVFNWSREWKRVCFCQRTIWGKYLDIYILGAWVLSFLKKEWKCQPVPSLLCSWDVESGAVPLMSVKLLWLMTPAVLVVDLSPHFQLSLMCTLPLNAMQCIWF